MKFGKKKALCFGLSAAQIFSLPVAAIVAYADETAKTATPNIYIDYSSKKLKGFATSGVTYNITGASVTPENGTCDIDSSMFGKTLEITATADGKSASDPQTLVIPSIPSAPNVKATYPRNGYIRFYNDSLTSVDNLMYSLDDGTTWSNYYDGGEIGSGRILVNDTILVKYAATSSSFESNQTGIRTPTSNTASLYFSAPQFKNLEFEYYEYDYLPITIKNIGPGDGYIKSITMDYGYFYVYNETATIRGGTENTDITIAPVVGLPVGTYTSKLTITWTDDLLAEHVVPLTVSVRVVPRPIPAYTMPTSVYKDEIGKDGTPVSFMSETGEISKISLVKFPSGYVRDSVVIKDKTAYFMQNAAVGDYMFEVIPVDYASYQRNYVTVSVVNDEYNPEIAKNTTQLTDKIGNAKRGDTIKVAVLSTITSAQVKAAAEKGLNFEVKVNNVYSWNISAASLADTASSLNLSLKDETIPTDDVKNAVFGKYTKATGLTVNASCGKGGVLSVNTGYTSTEKSPTFANLYKYNSKGVLEFQKVVRVNEDGTAEIPMEEAGKYSIVIAKETKLLGDMDNSCKLTSNDALMILRLKVSGEKVDAQNTPKAAFAGNKTVSARDALAILKYIVGKKD